MKPKILVIYTGGTIGMIKDYISGLLKPFDFDNILERIPELHQLNCIISTISFKEPIDSSNMNICYYVKIGQIIVDNYDKYEGFVVLTGSDTMSYTASAISFMLENLQKPVVFTGSQLPIGDLRTDAKENLITSIEIVATQEKGVPILQEVGLYFEYKLYRANRTTKINAAQFEAFTSINYPPLAESGVKLKFNTNYLLKPKEKERALVFRKNLNEHIVVLKLFPSITLEVINAILEIPNLRGVIIETYGAGNAPTDIQFINTFKKAISNGIHVVNVTQCVGGSVLFGLYETSNQLKEIGVLDGKDMTTESAVAKMMYLLGQNLLKDKFKRYFETPLRGEMS